MLIPRSQELLRSPLAAAHKPGAWTLVRRLSPVLVASIMLFAPAIAQACKCMQGTDPIVARDDSALVVLVRITAGPESKKATDGSYSWDIHAYKFEVVARFKGDLMPKASEIVTTDASSAACGRNYEVGGEYLMFASKSPDGRWTDNACSFTRTRAVAEEKGDFARLGPDLDGVLPASMFEARVTQPQPAEGDPAGTSVDPFQPGQAKDAKGRDRTDNAADPDSRPPTAPPSARGCNVAPVNDGEGAAGALAALLFVLLGAAARRKKT